MPNSRLWFACLITAGGLLPGTAAAGSLAATTHKPSKAPPRTITTDHTYNAPYCELLFVKTGKPRGYVADVWNTLGLGVCPAKWWKALNPAQLVKHYGALLLLPNGPRNFVMDRASITNPGPVRSFEGQRLRMVADVEISSLIRPGPYTDTTVARDNTFTWKRGRSVHELVAPSGRTYVMQSYSREIDKTLSIGQLDRLRSRLRPPAGWKYRNRKLRSDLTLRTNLTNRPATIIQDDLNDTYQLER
jgi:hypothetical protein